MLPVHILIDDPSRVAEARRVALTAARDEGLNETDSANMGIIVTEAATNLWKHARQGEIHISRLSNWSAPGVEILAIDHGPGMPDLDNCLADGYSTAGTAGTGLGAIKRLARDFDAYTQRNKGTVLLARNYSADSRPLCGAVRVPVRNEQVCGDAWSMRTGTHGMMLFVADGLGHGIQAADASNAAVEAFGRAPLSYSPAQVIETVHLALRGTRGAAVAVAFVEAELQRVRYAGLGNVSGVILGGPKPQYMLSHNGTAGHQARRFQEFEYALPVNAVVAMHSDGLSTNWTLDVYPGLLNRDPSIIAGVLYRDAARGRDDACVIVMKSALP